MISFKNITSSIKDNHFTISLCLVGITMPFSINVSTLSIYLLTLSWICHSPFKSKVRNFLLFKGIVYIFLSYYALHVLGLVYTENTSAGLKILEKNLAFVALPLLILTGKPLTMLELKIIFKSFIASCFLCSIINLSASFSSYLTSRSLDEFFYYNLTKTFDFHPIYLSAYFLLCVILLNSWQHQAALRGKMVYLALQVFFLINIFLLESKMIYLAVIIILSILSFYFLKKNLKPPYPAVIISVSVIIFSILISKYNKRFREISSINSLSILQENSMTDFSKVNGLTVRLLFWRFSMNDFIKNENYIWGLGTGDVQDFLDSTYERHNMALTEANGVTYGYYGYDTHNQFLDVFLRLGIIGLTFFLFGLWLTFRYFFLRSNFIALAIFGTLVLLFSTETFFGLNKGIIFFCFFFSLFVKQDTNV